MLRVNTVAAYREGLDATFLSAATRYWTSVFPAVRRQIKRWEKSARTIPDPTLRTAALTALRTERGNLEGAAAFAAFVPRAHRTSVITAAVAFQIAYDYADAVVEQPGVTTKAGVRQLHQALLVAVTPSRIQPRYYSNHDPRVDNGYLPDLVATCQGALAQLPSLSAVLPYTQRAVKRIVDYQEHNHGGHHTFARWAGDLTAATNTDLWWWETGAAAGSSLLVFALMATATDPTAGRAHAAALTDAYFPWIGALHTMLDSLIDLDEDRMTGQHNPTLHYQSWRETASQLRYLTNQAVARARLLPDSDQHLLIVAALVGFYLSAPQADEPRLSALRETVLSAVGCWAAPALLVQRSSRVLHSGLRRLSDR